MIYFNFLYSSLYTGMVYKDWQDDPIITVINTTSYPISNINFPSITICSQGLAKDVVEKVMLQQFKSYLTSRSLIEECNTNLNQSKTSNASTTNCFEKLTSAEVSI